jgi:methyl-accepting chemotaxis protein
MRAGLHAVCKQLDAGQGAFYLLQQDGENKKLILKSGYALNVSDSHVVSFELGEGLIGQAAAAAKTVYIDEIPQGYVKIISGLGSASPRSLLIVSVKQHEKVLGMMEIASFTELTEQQRKFADEAAQLIAQKISTK